MDIQEFISGIKKLSPTPKILPDLRRLLKDGESNMNDIISLIGVSMVLTSQIIRASNTPYYGATTSIQNLEEAVNRIGFHEVYRLVALLICSDTYGQKNEVYNLSADELLSEAISCGLMMQVLARQIKGDHEEAYTIGLLHSIGKTAIDAFYRTSPKNTPSFKANISKVMERKVLGFNHDQAGAVLLEKWNFRDGITKPILHQYSPAEAGDFKQSAYALSLSKMTCPYLNLEPQLVFEHTHPDLQILGEVGIDEDGFIESVIGVKVALDDLKDLIAIN